MQTSFFDEQNKALLQSKALHYDQSAGIVSDINQSL